MMLTTVVMTQSTVRLWQHTGTEMAGQMFLSLEYSVAELARIHWKSRAAMHLVNWEVKLVTEGIRHGYMQVFGASWCQCPPYGRKTQDAKYCRASTRRQTMQLEGVNAWTMPMMTVTLMPMLTD
jgi:hypothetical protein